MNAFQKNLPNILPKFEIVYAQNKITLHIFKKNVNR